MSLPRSLASVTHAQGTYNAAADWQLAGALISLEKGGSRRPRFPPAILKYSAGNGSQPGIMGDNGERTEGLYQWESAWF